MVGFTAQHCQGHVLIDDAPKANAHVHSPTWEHVWFTQPYNAVMKGQRRLNQWQNWRTESPLPMLLGHLGKSEPEKIQQEPFLNQVRLFYASAAGDPVNVKSLLEEKADVNYKDHNARTALHSVCGCKSAGAKETARLLLRHKANVNAIDNAGMSPMDIAVKVQNLSIQRLLEDVGKSRQ
eukprot:g27182.t1